MSEYWKSRPTATMQHTTPLDSLAAAAGLFVSDFDRHCLKLLVQGDEEGWMLELQRYLKDLPANIMKDTDILEWWSVSSLFLPS